MILKELILKNFGKFQNTSISLKPGVNVIYGENESGKSTLHTFLQGIFFGMTRKRGRASKTDAYTRCMPWENTSSYGGSVVFTCAGKQFRLKRDFGKGPEQAELFCETDGELLSIEDGDLQMLLGNISEQTYQNTTSIGQMKSRTEQGLVEELKEYMANFQGSGDFHMNPETALEILKEKRKAWEKQEQLLLKKKEKREEELQYRIQYEEEEMESLYEKIKEAERNLRKSEDILTVPFKEKQQERAEIVSGFRLSLFLRIGLLAGAGVLFYLHSFWQLLLGAALLLGACWIFGQELRRRKLEYLEQEKKRKKAQQLKQQKKEADQARQQQKEKAQERKRMLEESLEERKTKLENLQEEYQEVREDTRGILEVRREIRCIETAKVAIQEAAQTMQSLTGSQLREKMSEIVKGMTMGKYQQVFLDKDFQLRLDTGEKCLQLYQVSYGTAEQVYLAFRMACAELLCKEEELPLLLDEVFAMYDDKRLSQTLLWLSEQYEQVLLFTCNRREMERLEEMEIPYHLVTLSQGTIQGQR